MPYMYIQYTSMNYHQITFYSNFCDSWNWATFPNLSKKATRKISCFLVAVKLILLSEMVLEVHVYM